MSSSVKTESLQLNMWQGSDIPQREDFVRDNVIIDNALETHRSDSDRHITSAERARWNDVYRLFTYFGNGDSSRTIALDSGFSPTWGLVFAINRPSAVTDFDNTSDYNYFGIVSNEGSMSGLQLGEGSLNVMQPVSPTLGNEYRNFNELGVTYVVILFA